MIISCPNCGASFNIKSELLGPDGRSVKCSKCAHRWHAAVDGTAQEAVSTAAAPAPAEAAATDAPAGSEMAIVQGNPAVAEEPSVADDDGPPDSAEDADQAAEEAAPMPPPGLRESLGLDAGDNATEGDAPKARSNRQSKSPPRKPRRSTAKILSFFVLVLLISGIAGAAFFMNQKIMMWLPASQRLYAMVGIEAPVLGQGLQIIEPTPKKEIDGNDEILIVHGEIKNTASTPIDVPLMRGALLDKQGKELQIWTFTAAKSQIAPGAVAQYRTEIRNPPLEAESLDITFTGSSAMTENAAHATEPAKKGDGPSGSAPAQGH